MLTWYHLTLSGIHTPDLLEYDLPKGLYSSAVTGASDMT